MNSLRAISTLGLEKTAVETLQEILDEMSEGSQVAATISRRLQTGYNILKGTPENMAKAKTRTRKRKRQITDWNIGQPLAFPRRKSAAVIERLAREAVAEGMKGPFKLPRQRRKKK
jgi:hypothetical protein